MRIHLLLPFLLPPPLFPPFLPRTHLLQVLTLDAIRRCRGTVIAAVQSTANHGQGVVFFYRPHVPEEEDMRRSGGAEDVIMRKIGR